MKSPTSNSGESRPMMTMTLDVADCDRREHRRHDLEEQGIAVERWDGQKRAALPFGKIVDISAGGVRVRMSDVDLRPDQQIRVRLALPNYAGISPFVAAGNEGLEPKTEWIGWLTVRRVTKLDGKKVEVGGSLVDMTEMDRGMLGLYLSTQPLAA